MAGAAALLISGAAMVTCAYAENTGFRNAESVIFPVKTAYDNKYTSIDWQRNAAENVGVPVPHESEVLIPVGNELIVCQMKDGSKASSVELPGTVSKSCAGAMHGALLVQPLENSVCVINTIGSEVRTNRTFDGTVDSDIAIKDDMAYFSVKNGASETFMCIKLDDALTTVWEYTAEADITPPTIQGDNIIFGAGSKLVACNAQSGAAAETDVGAAITKTPFASQYAVFITCSDSVKKLRLNADGTMEQDSLLTCETGSGTSAPIEYNSRLYVSSSTGFHVIDSINMEVSYTLEGLKNGSDPFICLGNGTRVYTVCTFEKGGMALHNVFDYSEEELPKDTIIAVMENYEGGRYAVAENGMMFFRDATGRIYALSGLESNIFLIILKLLILLALIVGVFVWLRMMGKRRAASMPKF